MLTTVVLEVLTKVTNIQRTHQNVLVGQRATAHLGQTQRFEQNGIVIELTAQAVLQDKLFLGYKVLLQNKGKSWLPVAEGSFQADISGTTQLLVSDSRSGNFIDLSVKTFAENTGSLAPSNSQGEHSHPLQRKRKMNVRSRNEGPA